MEVQEAAAPWDSLTVEGLPITYHESSSFKEPALIFDGRAARDDAALQTAGVSISRPLPALRARRHRLLRSVENLALILLGPNAAGE
jgi:hypothetical protein